MVTSPLFRTFKALGKRKNPRTPAFQPFMKPVSYFLQKQFHAVQCLYQLGAAICPQTPLLAARADKAGRVIAQIDRAVPLKARRLKFLCLDMLCVALIRRRKNQPLRLHHILEEILHWTCRAPVVLGGVEIVYREGRILNVVQNYGD